MLKIINKILLFIFLMLISIDAFSQGKKGPPTPPMQKMSASNFDGPGPPGLPIDGGLSFLIIAGTAYGAYELRKKKK